ncbi:hypothetical protein DFJ43DRAFT_1090631 [Lentinula guzmanii]|uniref:F-box domain-containing protein n=1 Tax=Lentinula guzmanii TaxID=2804957 RepID=A0AA38MX86_9AGAR|nr:hypothetical protein DFJ43DRAFT_1090631 [Lentinula guzmanii]
MIITPTNMLQTLPFLPTEVLTQIFTLTTTLDSGASLRSLLRVSQHFHDICLPLRFHCVSLTTGSSIKRLDQELKRLEGSPPHLQRILYLYISPTQSDVHPDSECETISQIFCILQNAAETLQTLTFIYHNTLLSTSVLGRLFRNSFPVLTELTIHGFYPFPSPMPSNESPASIPIIEMNESFMPMLQRLHLSGNRNPYGLLQLSSFDKCFPSLSHLRISGLLMAGSFVEEMKDALEKHTAYDDLKSKSSCGTLLYWPARLPNKLQSVVLQPGFMPPHNRVGVVGSAVKKDTWMMIQLKDIEEAAKRRRSVRVMLKDRMQDPDRVSVNSVLYCDWLGRMNGDEGCW